MYLLGSYQLIEMGKLVRVYQRWFVWSLTLWANGGLRSKKKADNNFNNTKNVMDKLTFCSKKLFYMSTAAYTRSTQEQMCRLICTFVVRIWHKQVFSWQGPDFKHFKSTDVKCHFAISWARFGNPSV